MIKQSLYTIGGIVAASAFTYGVGLLIGLDLSYLYESSMHSPTVDQTTNILESAPQYVDQGVQHVETKEIVPAQKPLPIRCPDALPILSHDALPILDPSLK